jgi:hypothetical protein
MGNVPNPQVFSSAARSFTCVSCGKQFALQPHEKVLGREALGVVVAPICPDCTKPPAAQIVAAALERVESLGPQHRAVVEQAMQHAVGEVLEP